MSNKYVFSDINTESQKENDQTVNPGFFKCIFTCIRRSKASQFVIMTMIGVIIVITIIIVTTQVKSNFGDSIVTPPSNTKMLVPVKNY